MSLTSISWAGRRRLWDGVILLKFRVNKPAEIPLPPSKPRPIRSVPLQQILPSISVTGILIADHVPADEISRLNRAFYSFQMWLSRKFGPNQLGLRPVDEDPRRRLAQAYGKTKRKLFPAPRLPEAFRGGQADLGQLAVSGPYAGYLRRTKDESGETDGRWEWDLRDLAGHETWPGLHSLGARVVFEVEPTAGTLEPVLIDCELGAIDPTHHLWGTAQKLALCALATHVSLVRHFNGVHLALGAKLSIATRNNLPSDHPLCRLLWPHIYGTHYSNELVTLGQMDPAGEFPGIFSYTPAGICSLFETTHPTIALEMYDPERDAVRRGLAEAPFETPGIDNLKRLFSLFHEHAANYIAAYYGSDAELAADGAVRNWLMELQQIVPNGVPLGPAQITREALARLIAVFIHVVVVEHELLGSFLWNYQLWTHIQPIRMYRSGEREPLDVYQRMVNANMLLNVDRTKLTTDFAYLALDEKGARIFRAFRERLIEVEAEMEHEPANRWRLTPSMLRANMNA